MGNSLNLHPTALFLPLTEPALFHPLAGWKEEGQSPSPVGFGAYSKRKDPFEELSPGGHPIMPNTLLLLSSTLAGLLSAGKVCARIPKEVGFSRQSHLKCGALSRAGCLPVYQEPSGFKEKLASTRVTCCLFFPEGGLHFPYPANFLSQASGKSFSLEVSCCICELRASNSAWQVHRSLLSLRP